jgi:alanyl-tRNA synthetase
MKGKELRRLFTDFFVERNHSLVASSPIIPPDDPTMLFTSAGMVQFKSLYAGDVDPLPYTRATSVQKCLRAGGKDSDLENVGRTQRHHTFFEMLGNFSFGDYFKREACAWGWEFVTQVMKIPEERLWISTYEKDPEAAEIWEKELGIPRSRIIPLNAKENFWGPAGETGACGPCSEILFFMGTDEELEIARKQDVPTIAKRIVDEGDVFFEIWNMVFPQYDQQRDGSRPKLKNRGIDTGAGLERMTTAINFIETGGKIGSPYETDLLWDIVKSASEITGLKYVRRFEDLKGRDPEKASMERLALNAISDHVRTLVFTLSEGMMPSNEGRGYVLRRIQRRALRFAHILGVNKPFMFKLVDPVIDTMGDAYPEIKEHPDHIKKVIRLEEESFLKTLSQGEKILSKLIENARDNGEKIICGDDVFKLHATFGFPVDLTDEVVRDAGLTIDRPGYNNSMKKHSDDAKKSWKGADSGMETEVLNDVFEKSGATVFLRRDESGKMIPECDSEILAIVKDGKRTETASKGDEILIILNKSCFYAESGGQVGDTGEITLNSAVIEITDTQKIPNGIDLHKGKVKSGNFNITDKVKARINVERRLSIMRNHTATHILQKALKNVAGKHITQQGSSVTPDSFRFDFSNPESISSDQLKEIEKIVQEEILKNTEVIIREMPIEEARKLGAIAPFGEKYGAKVRVVKIGDFSLEFCGGTHCLHTGQIGSLVIDGESSVASGVRRIEARTGMGAYKKNLEARSLVFDLCKILSVTSENIPERFEKMIGETKDLKKEIQKLRQEVAAGTVKNSGPEMREVCGIKFITHKTEGMAVNELRNLADTLGGKIKNGVVFIGNTDGKKVNLICKITGDALGKVSAGKIIKEIAKIVGGGGGGRDDMAQAGGKLPEKLPEALLAVEAAIKSQLE